MLFLKKFASWQETFADARDGDDGGGGNIWDHFGIILGACWIHFGTILRRPMQKQKFVNPKSVSLKWRVLSSSPQFDRQYISPQLSSQ